MAQVQVVMPKMGESITEGTVIAWHKQVGDAIDVDETLLEIGTDKVDTEVPSPTGGKVAAILVGEGDTVDVGTPIAMIETDVNAEIGDAPAASAPSSEPAEAAAPAPASTPAPVATPAPEPVAPTAVATASGPATDVIMPKMGESIIEGTVIKWHKAVGDTIEVDETLLEIATDKVDSDVPSPAAGVVQELLVAEGDTVDVGTVIARIGSGSGAAVSAPAATTPAAPASAPAPAPAHTQTASASPTHGGNGEIGRIAADGRFMSPLVRSIAEKEGLSSAELSQISGSGHDGRITKADVLGYLENRSAPVAAPAKQVHTPAPAATVPVSSDGRVEVVEMDRMRQIIAQHMIQSKQTSAHVTSFAEADLTNLVKLRESQKDAFFEREGIKLTYTPFFVHAAVDALREHPIMNCSVDGTKILIKKDYHIGIAVAIGKSGLVVPVIKSAGHRNIAGLAREAATLADRARNRQLQPDDLQGGTFTVTNIGSLGSIMGTPIIAQPQVAILATGAIKKRPVVMEDPELGDVIAIRHMMYVSMSYDHRIIDGAMASSFMHRFVSNIENFGPDTEL